MEEPRMAKEQDQPEVQHTAPLVESYPESSTDVEERAPEAPEEMPQILERVPEDKGMEEEQADAEMVLEKLDHEVVSGLTVGDGFRFGCGFVLALAIGTLAFMIVLTAFLAVGALMGFKLPFQ